MTLKEFFDKVSRMRKAQKLCSVMGWDLEKIAKMNLEKLASRKNRGVIDGNGDNR